MNGTPYTLHLGDCRAVLATLADSSVDSIVTDPPYHLTSNARGSHRAGDATTPHLRARIGDKGFMGKAWDGGDIAHNTAMWEECLRVLKPGGHLLAFSGTRTQHRMVCAIEDAGFEVRDQIGWLYGSGFPKSRNLGGDWEGWGTALKPAWEPICVARKPFAGTVAENVLQHGTGALNIDGCRVPLTVEQAQDRAVEFELGRWPANVIHDGSDEVLQAFPSAPGQKGEALIDPVSRKTQNVYNPMGRGHEASAQRVYADAGGTNFAMKPGARRLDTGSAARFFYCAKASRADRNHGLPDPGPQFKKGTTLRDVEVMAAAGEIRGNTHPTVKPTDLMAYLCRLVTPAGGVVLDPFMGSGSTGKAAMREGFRFIGIDMTAEYVEIARARIEASWHAAEAVRKVCEPSPQIDLFEETT
ncbi:MAG TPA: site-specific DNA-methyltransferase [Paraburkholderia sp.]